MGSASTSFEGFDTSRVPSPCHVIDLAALERNLRILRHIADAADVKVLLALKAFACFAVADRIDAYLHGTAASGLWEARLGRTRFKGEVHTYAPGLKQEHLPEILSYSDHLILNSLNQWRRFADRLKGQTECSYGLRINPRHSEVENPTYDPCAAWSRTSEALAPLKGLHVHGLCDQGFEPFERLLEATESRFGRFFGEIEWINLGGGQLLTAGDYPVERLIERLREFRRRWGLEVYLEPGTAVALDAGALVTEVLDSGYNDGHFVVLDASATCHVPDVIEAPYTPDLLGATICGKTDDSAARDEQVFRLGGPTCLAGDTFGTYRLDTLPKAGDRLLFLDTAYYTMVKSTTFNGTGLPALALWDSRTDDLRVIRQFDYQTFESRLA